jgi:hypothetical protein
MPSAARSAHFDKLVLLRRQQPLPLREGGVYSIKIEATAANKHSRHPARATEVTGVTRAPVGYSQAQHVRASLLR